MQEKETKKCSQCKRTLPVTEYYSRGNGNLRSECKQCHKKRVNAAYNERKNKVNEERCRIGCAKCGDKRPYVLDYHHKNPEIKEKSIARMTSNTNKMQNIQKEISKCIVLCSNCHREFHYFNSRKKITIEEYILQKDLQA